MPQYLSGVEILNRPRVADNRILKAMILDTIEERGEVYSAGIGIRASVSKIRKALFELEVAGEIVSELRDPPFEGCPSGGIQRRYYRRASGLTAGEFVEKMIDQCARSLGIPKEVLEAPIPPHKSCEGKD